MFDKYEDATMLCIESKFLSRLSHTLNIEKEKLTLAEVGESSLANFGARNREIIGRNFPRGNLLAIPLLGVH